MRIPAQLAPIDASSSRSCDADEEARAVLIEIQPGQQLGDHQVKEDTWVAVLQGTVLVDTGRETVEAPPGTLVHFDPDERRAISSPEGARVLLLLAPWPGQGHYRGGDGPAPRNVG